jgi:hypothetical protein
VDESRAMALRLQEVMAAMRWSRKPLTVSVGLVSLAQGFQDASALLQGAWQALHYARNRGCRGLTHFQDLTAKAA